MNQDDPTGAERQRRLVERRRAAGLVELTHIWLCKEDREKVQKFLRPLREKALRHLREWDAGRGGA